MPRGALFCITLLAIAACEVAPGPHRGPPATADTATGSAAAGAGSSANTNPPTANPPTANPPPANPPPGNPTPAPPNDGAGSAAAAAVPPPPAQPKDSCVKAANHIAELQSASLTDPTQKQTFDQQRAQVVAQVAAGCTTEAWSDAVVDCISNAQSIAALTPCSDMLRKEREVKAPAPPPPPPAAQP